MKKQPESAIDMLFSSWLLAILADIEFQNKKNECFH